MTVADPQVRIGQETFGKWWNRLATVAR